jgi:hypothetical protein
MQTLIFNTTTKSIKLYENYSSDNQKTVAEMSSIPTVKVCDGFYEVIQSDEFEKKYPVLRLPIANTNMVITK